MPSSSEIVKLKTASPVIKLDEADMLEMRKTTSPTEGARVVRAVEIKNQFCSGAPKITTERQALQTATAAHLSHGYQGGYPQAHQEVQQR